jgi:hypothetical protein
MYYSETLVMHLTVASGRDIDEKYPAKCKVVLTKQRPEWEIVGAFASDPIAD